MCSRGRWADVVEVQHIQSLCGFACHVPVKWCARCSHFNTLMHCILGMQFMLECAMEMLYHPECGINSGILTSIIFTMNIIHLSDEAPMLLHKCKNSQNFVCTKFLWRTSVHLANVLKRSTHRFFRGERSLQCTSTNKSTQLKLPLVHPFCGRLHVICLASSVEIGCKLKSQWT